MSVKVETATKPESWDFAGTMNFTENYTRTAVNDVNLKGKGKVHPRNRPHSSRVEVEV